MPYYARVVASKGAIESYANRRLRELPDISNGIRKKVSAFSIYFNVCRLAFFAGLQVVDQLWAMSHGYLYNCNYVFILKKVFHMFL